MDTNTSKETTKTADISAMPQDKKSTERWPENFKMEDWLRENGLPVNSRINKTGSCIMPAPKHSQSVKQQQDSHTPKEE